MNDAPLGLHPDVQRLRDENDLLREELVNLLTESHDLIATIKPNLLAMYQTKIGAWELRLLKLQFQAARARRRVELIRASLNRNEKPDLTAIEGELELELLQWQTRLQEAAGKIKAAEERLTHLLAPEADRELKTLYYKLVKQLHPDLNPSLSDDQKRLWHRIHDAYEAGDLLEIRALAILVEKEGKTPATADSLDKLRQNQRAMKAQIEQLLKEIERLENEPPLTLRRELENDAWVAGRRTEIDAQCAEWEKRCSELEAHERCLLEGHDVRQRLG